LWGLEVRKSLKVLKKLGIFRGAKLGGDDLTFLFFSFFVLSVFTRPLTRQPTRTTPDKTVHCHGRRWATNTAIGCSSVLVFSARNRPKPTDALPYLKVILSRLFLKEVLFDHNK